MVFDSARTVFARILDGVAGLTAELRHAGQHVEGIRSVGDIRARSIDHRLHADASIALDGSLSIDKAAKLMARYRDDASHHLPSCRRCASVSAPITTSIDER